MKHNPLPIQKAVIDTGPLFTVLVLNFVQRTQYPAQKRQNLLRGAGLDWYLLESPTRQENYLRLFASIPVMLTTSHVIGELQGQQKRIKSHDQSLYGADLRNFWLCSMELLQQKNLNERLLRLLDLYAQNSLQQAVCEIGPTDTALIELARQENCVLLTDDDRTLAPLARANNVKYLLVKPLLDETI
ncbi:MAG: hypothetical protein HYR56_12505 [Acidobacteria bacterium]|nr:hypothetical protein [Acidobacteriota bacterium]MBI3425200.1 hypothetical protein [Acidobacteriota bacterium]